MKLKTRFTLVGIGIVIFLIITPALILFARGFTINWNTRQIVKTGAIMIKTDPGGANIFLNGKRQNNLTPSNFRFLTPGEYDIRIEKDGYQSWSKRLSVKAQLVTRVNLDRDFISLFLKNAKLQEARPASQARISKTGNEIIFLNNGQANSISTTNGDITNLGNITPAQTPLLLSDINRIYWENGKALLQILQSKPTWGLSDKQIGDIRQVEATATHIAATIAADLYSLDNSAPAPLDKNVSAFTIDGDSVWYLQENFLKRFDYNTGNAEIINDSVPKATTGRIIRANNQIYAILDSKLYVLSDSFEKIYDNATAASWDFDTKQLMISNNNEILTYSAADKKTDLILRSSSLIKNPIFNWNAGYIFFENEGKIKAIELDGRDHRNIYSLINNPDPLANIAVSSDGKKIFTISQNAINEYEIR